MLKETHMRQLKNKSAMPTTQNTLRIISGKWRGRRLPVINQQGLRPTPDHLRETLFNWLMHEVTDAYCLDGFAGTGALGFEALSRGAREIVFVENSGVLSRLLQSNINQLKCEEQGKVVHTDLVQWLQKTPPTPFDIIFLDPPFHLGLIVPVCRQLQNNGWVKQGTYIYVEKEHILSETLDMPTTWCLYKEKKVGQIMARIYIVGPEKCITDLK